MKLFKTILRGIVFAANQKELRPFLLLSPLVVALIIFKSYGFIHEFYTSRVTSQNQSKATDIAVNITPALVKKEESTPTPELTPVQVSTPVPTPHPTLTPVPPMATRPPDPVEEVAVKKLPAAKPVTPAAPSSVKQLKYTVKTVPVPASGSTLQAFETVAAIFNLNGDQRHVLRTVVQNEGGWRWVWNGEGGTAYGPLQIVGSNDGRWSYNRKDLYEHFALGIMMFKARGLTDWNPSRSGWEPQLRAANLHSYANNTAPRGNIREITAIQFKKELRARLALQNISSQALEP